MANNGEVYELKPGMSLFLDYAENNGWAVLMKRWFSEYKKEWTTSYAVRHNGISITAETDSDVGISEQDAIMVIEKAKEIVGDF